MCKKCCIFVFILVLISASVFVFKTPTYFPLWAKYSKNNSIIKVLDTNSSLGRYSNQTKDILLQDLAKIHGHLCDGLVITYLELKLGFEKLFPDGVVDRTDLRVITKNGPCWVDASMFLTGARINFKTLSIDNSLINAIIIQKISTGEAYRISLKEGVFPSELEELEAEIKITRIEGRQVTDKAIKRVEFLANNLSKKLLNSPVEKLLDVEKLENYEYKQNIQTGIRTDVLNKSYNI